MQVQVQLRRLVILGLGIALGACFHEPLDPGFRDDAGNSVGGSGAGGSAGGPGTGGGSAKGGSPGTGGKPNQGGAGGSAAGGAGGTAGSGGQIGGSPADAGSSGGKGGADAGKDARPDGLTCGPVCAIFCPNGNVLDERGCPTCKCNPVACPAIACVAIKCPYGTQKDMNGCETCQCNPPPTCKPVTCKLFCENGWDTGPDGCEICKCKPTTCAPTECPGPAPGAPVMKCEDGSTGGPVCERTNEGRCAWIFRACPEPPDEHCSDARDAATCATMAACHWLEPGCFEPKLSTAGCFARSQIGCSNGCPAGKTCLKRVINPCPAPRAGLVAPPPETCAACGQTVALCL